MDLRLLSSAGDLSAYDAWVKNHPQGTLWQSLEWKRFQEAVGREVRIYAGFAGDRIAASALAVIDRTAFGLSAWDIPRGPLGEPGDERSAVSLMERIVGEARGQRCFTLFLSPITPLTADHVSLTASKRHEQPSATRVLDLTLSDEDLLRQMKPKGRYNIAVAQKHGVRVERSEDIAAFYALLKQTGSRDRFGILPKAHYEAFLKALPGNFLLLATQSATSNRQPIAALLGVIWKNQGIYYYGASDYEHRALMAPYLLQWEALRHCKDHGCVSYDLLGITPPPLPTTTNNNTPLPQRGRGGGWGHWAGVSAFKEKFGGTVVTYPEERQIVLQPLAHTLLQLKRRLLG